MEQIRNIIYTHRGSNQNALIAALNPRIRGWVNYHRFCAAKTTFSRMDYQLYRKLSRWAKWRHHRKSRIWRFFRYWHRDRGRINFGSKLATLVKYADTPIQRHVKVQGHKSPFDGDWAYWIQRLGRGPSKSNRVITLLKRQKHRCSHCGLHFMSDDPIEIHHQNGNHRDHTITNLVLIHGHCHDFVHRARCS
ncbi:MAG: group II intron maturase-specific domain-containing protein [Chloroflexota bacterium]